MKHIFTSSSIFHSFKKISLKNLNIPYLILKELITNHSLKDNFHQSTIVNLFESNKLLSLFLYDQKVIDQTAWELLIMRCQKTDFTPNHIFLAYYWPEIVENPEIYNEVTALKPTVSNIFQDLNNPPNLNKFKHIRDSGYSNNPLAAIIRKDDITTFLRYIRSNPDININSKIICLFFDTPISTLIQNGKISPLDYSTFYGAIKIFKYLWANHAPMSENTVECCIAGGNIEIFHIVINQSDFIMTNQMRDQLYFAAVKYYQPEIAEYLIDAHGFSFSCLSSQFIRYFYVCNFVKLYQLFNDVMSKDNNIKNIMDIINDVAFFVTIDEPMRPYFFYKLLFNQPIDQIIRYDKFYIFSLFIIHSLLKQLLVDIMK